MGLTNPRCTNCGLHAQPGLLNQVWGRGDDVEIDQPYDVMFVDSGPGDEENRTVLAYGGPAGQILMAALKRIGFPESLKKFYTYGYRCGNIADGWKTPKTKKKEKDVFDSCLAHIEEEILTHRPKVVVSLGADVWGRFFKQKDG